jgi:pseudoazurin
MVLGAKNAYNRLTIYKYRVTLVTLHIYTKENHMKNLLSTVAVMVALSTPAFAADTTVEMLNKRDDGAKMVYSEDITRIDVGDTVTWVPTSKGHNVEFIAGPDGWDAPKKSKLGKEYAYTFDTPGVYLYQCSPHKTMGMIAIVVVGDGDNDVSGTKVGGKSNKKLKALLDEL